MRDRVAGHDGRVNRWRQWSWQKKTLSGAGVFFLLLFLLGVIGYAMTDLPKPGGTNQASSIRYSDGAEIGRVGAENRKLVSLDNVSEPAQKAVLAAEDRGFYSEPGISPRGIFRALVANLRGGGVQQGGSTITQQYAKNAYLSHERTFTRKVKEFFISLKLAHKLSKDQILENYLNTIYFGRGAAGIEVASNTYFNKHAKDLTVAEGAVLAASIRSPAAYDPSRHSTRAEDRWRYVLDGMVKKGWLTKEERDGLTYPSPRHRRGRRRPHQRPERAQRLRSRPGRGGARAARLHRGPARAGRVRRADVHPQGGAGLRHQGHGDHPGPCAG
jgi:membrane peptidoglycan carboxypeptidase